MGDHHSMGDMGWVVTGMGFAGLVWLLICLAILVLIIVAVVWLIDRLRGDSGRLRGGSATPGGRASGALAELDLRYARGELDRDTYLQMRRDLAGP